MGSFPAGGQLVTLSNEKVHRFFFSPQEESRLILSQFLDTLTHSHPNASLQEVDGHLLVQLQKQCSISITPFAGKSKRCLDGILGAKPGVELYVEGLGIQ